jgi:predicted histidine transporter YuiF (NhaC family)
VGVYALFVLCLILISSCIDRRIVGRLAPLIQADLGVRDTLMGLLAGASFAIGTGLEYIIGGAVADNVAAVGVVQLPLLGSVKAWQGAPA